MTVKPECATGKKMSLTDTEILDRIGEVKADLTVVSTKLDILLTGKTRCDDHAKRVAELEQNAAADKRVRGFVYAALVLGIPTVTAVIVALMK